MSVLTGFAPFTGFGDDTNHSVKFTIEHPEQKFPQWQGGPRLGSIEIPNSDRTIVQNMGRTPRVVTWLLSFATLEDAALMDSLQGTAHTLRYLYGITLPVGGTHEVIAGIEYLKLPDTLLVGLTSPAEDNGYWEAVATFQRTDTIGDVYGFARYS